MPRTAAAPPNRRTQAERSATTRAKLLDSALDCVVELGYAGTTTTVVAERAGVSRGAQLHHFPTRAALVAAAVEHLYKRLTEAYQTGFARLPHGAGQLRAAIALLWSMFAEPRYAAVLDLFTAARTDPELRAHLQPIAERHQANVYRLARAYFPATSEARDFDATLTLVLDAMQGMASNAAVHTHGPETARRLDTLHQIAARALLTTRETRSSR
jgi:AcrR family transcriptional regulator